MGALDYLADRSDARVIAALTHPCAICKAKPGQDCRNPGPIKKLGRIVHLYRVEP